MVEEVIKIRSLEDWNEMRSLVEYSLRGELRRSMRSYLLRKGVGYPRHNNKDPTA